jgi:RNA polymerase sigma factor (sigma-70 family)
MIMNENSYEDPSLLVDESHDDLADIISPTADTMLLDEVSATSAQSVLSDVEEELKSEIEDEDPDNDSGTSPPATAADINPAGLNELYEAYFTVKTEENLEHLLKDVRNYSLRVVAKICGNYDNKKIIGYIQDDVANTVQAKVWKHLDEFKNQSTFKSWVYRIAQNAATDALNKITRGKDFENELLPWKDYGAPTASEVGTRSPQNSGASPAGTADPEDDDAGGHGAAAVQSLEYGTAVEDGYIAELDFQKTLRKLASIDKRICTMYHAGYSPIEIGEAFRRDAKWASNQLTRLKLLLGHELYIAGTILHTCRIGVQSVSVLQADVLYAEDGLDFRALPKCRCHKTLTDLEVKALIGNGAAAPIYKLGSDGKPEVVAEEVWAQQAVRVPRCGLSSNRAHIEKAFGVGAGGVDTVSRNIEMEHEISVESLRKLIVRFRPDDWEGRTRFTSFTEQRTKDCYTKPEFRRPDEKPPKYPSKNIGRIRCDKRTRFGDCSGMINISEYPDGALKYECSACDHIVVMEPESSLPNPSEGVVVQPSGERGGLKEGVGTKCRHGIYQPSNADGVTFSCSSCTFIQTKASKSPTEGVEVLKDDRSSTVASGADKPSEGSVPTGMLPSSFALAYKSEKFQIRRK